MTPTPSTARLGRIFVSTCPVCRVAGPDRARQRMSKRLTAGPTENRSSIVADDSRADDGSRWLSRRGHPFMRDGQPSGA